MQTFLFFFMMVLSQKLCCKYRWMKSSSHETTFCNKRSQISHFVFWFHHNLHYIFINTNTFRVLKNELEVYHSASFLHQNCCYCLIVGITVSSLIFRTWQPLTPEAYFFSLHPLRILFGFIYSTSTKNNFLRLAICPEKMWAISLKR
jgi:hypothetical protein